MKDRFRPNTHGRNQHIHTPGSTTTRQRKSGGGNWVHHPQLESDSVQEEEEETAQEEFWFEVGDIVLQDNWDRARDWGRGDEEGGELMIE